MQKALKNGADFIVPNANGKSIKNIFTVTGGACAFIIDAISKCENLNYDHVFSMNKLLQWQLMLYDVTKDSRRYLSKLFTDLQI